tara:strand:+ start:1366 stop:2214 length:849 start_codon:yes stop_codon:yes gene_type:complete
MPDRIHSSDIQLFVDDARVPAVTDISINSSKGVKDIQRLGAAHVVDRVLNAGQSSSVEFSVNLTTGSTGIDPIYSYQQMGSGFLSTGNFDLKIKDKVGVTTVSGGALTSYSINGSVGEIVKGSTSYVGDGAIFTSAGALTDSDASNDIFDGFFRPKDIEITSAHEKEGIDTSSFNIQDFSIAVSVDKSPVTRLGTRVPRFRYPSMPSKGTLSFNAVKNQVTGLDLSSLICDSGLIKIKLKDVNGNSVMEFDNSGCCLETVNETTSLDGNTTVNFAYYFPIIA